MPVLAFKRNIEGDHPVVDQFRGRGFAVVSSLLVWRKYRGRHRCGNIITYLGDVVLTEAGVHFGTDVRGERHALYIIQNLIDSLFAFGEECLAPFGFPF